MTVQEEISRLQGLLARVQARAQEARPVARAFAAAPRPTTGRVASSAPPPPLQADVERKVDVERPAAFLEVQPSEPEIEIEVDLQESIQLESGAQLVAQQSMPLELDELEEVDDNEEDDRDHTMVTVSEHLPAEENEVVQAPPANEIEEPAPSSSRRPIAAEEVVESESEKSAPRHTRPPESGKQVAAPSVHPPASRQPAPEPPVERSSTPPPSLEGEGLADGWREPGLGGPQSALGTLPSVRAAAPSAPPPAPAPAAPTRLSPDVTRPDLAANASVARFEGPAPVARPTTLGELLDMSLAL